MARFMLSYVVLTALFCLAAVDARPGVLSLEKKGLLDAICQRIDNETPSSTEVDYLATAPVKYDAAIHHWASSSSELSDCVIEPGTAAAVGQILQIVGETRTPFAVKGGGHSTNPGFSSTKGIHISLDSFSAVNYNAESQTVEIGAGLVWDDVYEALEPFNVNVVGGRVSGVGVAGFTLGGGFSWKTNQYGLTIDTVVSFELVKPDGTVSTVTQTSDSELFFGLKAGGGLNNFGIVTKFTLRTFPQTQVWGGLITFTANTLDDVSAATAAFSATVTDPKAAIITTYNFIAGAPGVSLLIFYDAPTPPAGIFDPFLAIPHLTRDVSTRSFLSLVQGAPVAVTTNLRASFHMVPVLDYSPEFIDAVVNQTVYWGTRLTLLTGTFFSYAVEPFLQNIYSHNSVSTAYPFSRSRFFSPFNIYFAWVDPTQDDLFRDAVLTSASALVSAAQADGQVNLDSIPLYPNYAASSTPLEQVYGSNLPRLRALKSLVDPSNVMGLAGGFKL